MKFSGFFTVLSASAVLLFAGAVDAGSGPADILREYVFREDGVFGYELVDEKDLGGQGEVFVFNLTSQSWRGMEWKHRLVLIVPEIIEYEGAAVLVVDGGRNPPPPFDFEGRDFPMFVFFAGSAGVPVALLNQVPNQPIWGLREDALIAETFSRFLEDGCTDWPLLLPMAKSASRAMDAVAGFLLERTGSETRMFVMGGGSKRGWTSYLAAAADSRVKGLIPAVIDMVNIPAHLRRQLKTYGGYSKMLGDYEKLGLMERMDSQKGVKLLELVDPYSYRELLSMPKLIVLGTNDPYWTVDSANLYFHGLAGPSYLHYAPGAGHEITPGSIPTLAGFIHCVFSNTPMPELEWEHGPDGSLAARWEPLRGEPVLKKAFSPSRDFRRAEWHSEELAADGSGLTVSPEAPEEGFTAYYLNVRFPDFAPGGFGMNLSTGMTVLPDVFPHVPAAEKAD